MARSLRIEYPGAWYHVTCRVSKGDVDSHSVLHLTAGQRIFGIAPCADRPVSICDLLYIISWGGEPTNPLAFGAKRNENRFMRCRNHVPTPTDSKRGQGSRGSVAPEFPAMLPVPARNSQTPTPRWYSALNPAIPHQHRPEPASHFWPLRPKVVSRLAKWLAMGQLEIETSINA